MKFTPTALPDVFLVEPVVHGDARGFFLESYREEELARAGIAARFVQDNHSGSRKGILRGLHYQCRHPQGKLVRVTAGEVFDAAVDLRRGTPGYGKWVGARLSAENRRMLWIPPGFAHGFLVLSDWAEVQYKATEYYAPEADRSIRWNDPAIGVDWPLESIGEPQLSEKDARAPLLAEADPVEGLS